jgi:hypothetical protein
MENLTTSPQREDRVPTDPAASLKSETFSRWLQHLDRRLQDVPSFPAWA